MGLYMKRIVALFLSFVLVVSMIPVGSFAAEEAGGNGETGQEVSENFESTENLEQNDETEGPTEPQGEDLEVPSENPAEKNEDLSENAETEESSQVEVYSAEEENSAESLDAAEDVTSITILPERLTMTVGEDSFSLEVTVLPENATETITWESSDAKVATVQDGVITPVSMGTAKIYAKTESGVSSNSCEVEVWGTCGDDAKWFLDGTTLKIDGSGDIEDFKIAAKVPWGTGVRRNKATTVEIGKDITRIGNNSFLALTTLTEIRFADGSELKSIGKDAFKTTTKLNELTIPGTVEEIQDSNIASKDIYFQGPEDAWERLNYAAENVYVLDEDGTYKKYETDPYSGKCGNDATWHYDNDTGALTISGTGSISDFSGTDFPWKAFKDSIRTVVIADGITAIGSSAFRQCGNLTKVELPSSVTKIGTYAFYGDSELAEAALGNVTQIGDYAFCGDAKLAEAALENVSKIGSYAFQNCSGIASAALTSVTEIGQNAFDGCSGLTSLSLGSESTAVASMGTKAFQGCSSLTNVQFINVEIISYHAFQGASSLQSVDLTGVKKIGDGAFGGMKQLKTVLFGEKTEAVGGAAFEGTGVEEITIPSSVTSIGNGSFKNCTSLKKVTVQDGVTSIPTIAFNADAALKEITLPASLTEVKDNAFQGCTALAKVNYSGTGKQWSQIDFTTGNELLLAARGVEDVTGITLTPTELKLTVKGANGELLATVLPENATDQTVLWSSSDEKIATVKDGIVTPVAEGKAIITATAGGFSATCSVTVTGEVVGVTGIALTQTEVTLEVGESTTLEERILPENATEKGVTWASADSKIASVENGKVTALCEGETIITVKSVDGEHTAQCKVTVTAASEPVELSEFQFRLSGTENDSSIGVEQLSLVSDGNGAYRLIAPTSAVAGYITTTLTITAPESLKENFYVTYTTWNNDDGGSHCFGEKTEESVSGQLVLSDYFNSWARVGKKLEYSDFVIRVGSKGKEYKVSFSLYNDLKRLWIYPSESGSSSRMDITKTGDSEYSATVVRGTEYTILARGGLTTSLIQESKLTISEAGTMPENPSEKSEAKFSFTPGDETEKIFEIRITNDIQDPTIAEKVYTLKLSVEAPPEKPIAFSNYTVLLNGESLEPVLQRNVYSIPQITQYDDLKITIHVENVQEDATYAWTRGTGANAAAVGDNSSTLVVDTSLLTISKYIFNCTITSNGQTIKAPIIRVNRVTALTVPAPVIAKQPESAAYKLGEAAKVLTVETSEKSYGTKYQWYVANEANRDKATAIERETNYYYLPPTDKAGTLYYFCELYDTKSGVNSEKVYSDFAEIVVDASDTPWTGDGTVGNPFVLVSEADLLALSERVAKGQSFAGMYFQMANDISISGSWKPVGTTKDGSDNGLYGKNMLPFSGILDGNGYTITIPAGGKPLFNYVRQATVQNLSIQGTEIDGYGLVDRYEVDYGVLGEYSSNNVPETINIVNCHILKGTSIKNSGFLGGYASGANIVRISNCSVEEGVVIGYGMGDRPTGSLAGDFNGYAENCTSAAIVKGKNKVGGLIGAKGQSMGPCEIRNCTFTGTVESNGSAGGILGNGYDAGSAPNSPCVTIIDCKVSGTVSGANYVGGILGAEGVYITQCWGNGVGIIRNNEFTGTIQSSGKYVGGIIGYMCSINKYNLIENNYYVESCGAEKGIGFIKYVDTSCESHETESGAIYFNTANGLPGITGVSTKELNRTDDPLGADKDKLCFSKKRTEAYVKSIAVSGTYKTEYLTDEKFDATGIIVTATWSNGDVTTPAISEVTFTGFNSSEPGDVTIKAQYRDSSTTFVLHIKPKSSVITVKVSVLGDTNHGDNGSAHGLKMGGLTPWVPEMSVEANTDETVWDVIQRVAQSKNLKIQAVYTEKYSSYYIESVNGLGQFDNGKFSGWMYTVNGTHPQVGVSKKHLKQGDVIILHYTDDYTKEEGGMAPAEDTSTAQKVIDLINKIGTVTYTDACKQRIDAARSAYDALTAAEKNKVGSNNLATLTKAEAEYKRLMQAGATDVDNLISKIGTVTANSGPAISNAWNAYNALTAEQKALVKNFNTLQEATQKWNQLKADEVVKLIDKIEEPVTEKSKASIEAARKAYDGLTDAQKRLVTNTKKLTDAEKAYAQLTATPEDKEDAQKVIDLIKKLTNVTLDSEKDIQAARKAYDALTDLQKKLVDNYDVLTAAETKLAMLKAMGKVSNPYITTGDYMEALGTPSVGSIGGEWMAIGLARSGRNVPGVEDYYKKVQEYVAENIDPETGRLHKAKSTDNSRIIIALTAIGKDVTNVGGYNLLAGLSDLEFVKYQGNNGPIWALLALDSGNYPVPSGGTVTRRALIDEILRVQTSDGGWTVSGDKADSDMTGMALTALAPYYTKDLKVQEAIDKAIARLSEMQDEDGGYSTSYDGTTKIATSESISQVVTALSALGINADTDPRFVKNGNSVIDALLRYYVKGGGFKHIMDGELDGMATEQAYYALTAYYRFLSGKTNLYDMTDIIDMGGDPVEIPTEPTVPATTEPTEVEPAKTGFPWWILVICVVGGCGLGMVIAIVIIPKFGKFEKKD